MKRYRNKSPEEVMRMVTEEIIDRAIKLGRKNKREIYISKTSGGQGTAVETMDKRTSEGRDNREKFLSQPRRHYTISGLGSPRRLRE